MDAHYNRLKEEELVSWLKAKVGLENFRPGQSRLEKMIKSSRRELERRNILVVTIGGTNGKGETSHSLSYLLKSSGISYALWTSPHVVSVRERIVVNGECISYEDLWPSIHRCYGQLSDLLVSNPTYYEFLLMVFMDVLLTSPSNIGVCLFEVGLGGKRDGVNFFQPHLTAITSISRDHENILGKGYKNILNEKLGITRQGVPLITNLELQYCRQIVADYSKNEGVPWLDLFVEGISLPEDNYSLRNRCLAYTLFHFIREKESSGSFPSTSLLRESVRKISFPRTRGRSDLMTLGRTRIKFVGAHNVDGMRKLKQELDQQDMLFDFILLSFSRRSLLEMKDIIRILLVTPTVSRKIVITCFDHERAADESVLQQLIPLVASEHVEWHPRWEELLTGESASAREEDREDREDKKSSENMQRNVLVAGSYYFVGAVESWLLQK